MDAVTYAAAISGALDALLENHETHCLTCGTVNGCSALQALQVIRREWKG